MAKGKNVIIVFIFIIALIDTFFLVNTPEFTPKIFLGVPYNPFVIYLYFIMLAMLGVFFYK